MLEELLDNFIRNSEILRNSDYVRDFVIKLHYEQEFKEFRKEMQN